MLWIRNQETKMDRKKGGGEILKKSIILRAGLVVLLELGCLSWKWKKTLRFLVFWSKNLTFLKCRFFTVKPGCISGSYPINPDSQHYPPQMYIMRDGLPRPKLAGALWSMMARNTIISTSVWKNSNTKIGESSTVTENDLEQKDRVEVQKFPGNQFFSKIGQ